MLSFAYRCTELWIDPKKDLRQQLNSFVPQKTTGLNLSYSELSLYKAQELAEGFTALSPKIDTLILRDCQLGKLDGSLAVFLKNLPRSIENLDMAQNILSRLTPEECAQTFSGLPPTITGLSLRYNRFDREQLKAVLSNLNPLMEKLSLHGTWIFQRPDEELADISRLFPRKLKVLDLSFNNTVHELTGKKLEIIFANLPDTLEELDLSSNQLAKLHAAELRRAFLALPRSLKTLRLGSNEWGRFSADELISIFQALPPQLQVLDFSGYPDMFNCLSDVDFARFISSLSIPVSGINFEMSELRPSQLAYLAQRMMPTFQGIYGNEQLGILSIEKELALLTTNYVSGAKIELKAEQKEEKSPAVALCLKAHSHANLSAASSNTQPSASIAPGLLSGQSFLASKPEKATPISPILHNQTPGKK